MKGEKARAVETQGAAQVLAVSDAYQGEAGFLSATQQLSAPARRLGPRAVRLSERRSRILARPAC